ncbi:hypothetical protein KKG65_00135, partial [Patescibacteria group bacterium]|nr:hypothetical protein [Patescibacteria group bacterium]
PSESSDIPIIGKLFLRPSTNRVFDDFYTKLKSLEQEYGSLKLHGENQSKENFMQRSVMVTVSDMLSNYREETRRVIDNTNITIEEKKGTIERIRNKMLSDARTALDHPRDSFKKYNLGLMLFQLTNPSDSANKSMLKKVAKDF